MRVIFLRGGWVRMSEQPLDNFHMAGILQRDGRGHTIPKYVQGQVDAEPRLCPAPDGLEKRLICHGAACLCDPQGVPRRAERMTWISPARLSDQPRAIVGEVSLQHGHKK